MDPRDLISYTARSTFFEQMAKLQSKQFGDKRVNRIQLEQPFEPAPLDEVAGTIGLLRNKALSDYVHVKYAGTREDVNHLFNAVFGLCRRKHPNWFGESEGTTQRKKNQKRREGIITKLVALAGYQNIAPNVCITCRGQRWVELADKTHLNCHACEGRGIRKWISRDIAGLLDMAERTYTNNWADKLPIISKYFGHFEAKLLKARR